MRFDIVNGAAYNLPGRSTASTEVLARGRHDSFTHIVIRVTIRQLYVDFIYTYALLNHT